MVRLTPAGHAKSHANAKCLANRHCSALVRSPTGHPFGRGILHARREREWKMASPDGRAITLANNSHSRRAKVVKQGRSRSFGGLVRRSTRRAAATAAACAASPVTRLVSIHGSPRCHTPASADLAPFAAPSVWAQTRPCFGSTTFEWNECTSVS